MHFTTCVAGYLLVAAAAPSLNRCAGLPRLEDEDAQPETGQYVVPDEIVLVAGLGLINDTLAELPHVTYSGGCAAFRWIVSAEVPRQHQGGNSGSSQDIGFGVGIQKESVA